MNMANNKFNYQLYDNTKEYWIFADTSSKKHQFYFKYSLNSEITNTQSPKHWIIFKKTIIALILIFVLILSNILKTSISNDKLYDKEKKIYFNYDVIN